jgi:hypothetical protein
MVPRLQPEQAIVLLQAALAAKPADGPVNQPRRQLLADGLNASEKSPGLFTLTAHFAESIEGVWFWNSKYDDDLGACHPEGDDFCP